MFVQPCEDNKSIIFNESGVAVLHHDTIIKQGDPAMAVDWLCHLMINGFADSQPHRQELIAQFSTVVDYAEQWRRYGFIQAQLHEAMTLCRETQALRHLVSEGREVIAALQSSDPIVIGSAVVTIEHLQPRLLHRARAIHRLAKKLQGGQNGAMDC